MVSIRRRIAWGLRAVKYDNNLICRLACQLLNMGASRVPQCAPFYVIAPCGAIA